MRSKILTLLGAAILLAAATVAHGENYPSRPIRLVVPFPPGGVADPVARMIGDKVARSLGQSVIVDNRPGGAGIIAAEIVKQAPADGYTLFIGHAGTHAVNPSLYSILPYDPVKDFQPITLMMSTSHVLVVPLESPAKSVSELAALAKSRPEGLTFASQSVGTGGHLLGEMFKVRTGTNLQHVPYKGSAPALADLMAGRVDLFFDAVITSAPQIKGGKIRALATASKRRPPILAQVPTMTEAGYPGIELDFWFALFAPAGTPPGIVHKLNEEFAKALHSPEVGARFTEQGLDIITGTPEELAALIRADTE
ncbi:MAG TPA: tripartite tricarboxylate transporter substrate binding protein, partial [Burkholderiales bacterium]